MEVVQVLRLRDELYEVVKQLPETLAKGKGGTMISAQEFSAIVKLKEQDAALSKGSTWASVREEVSAYKLALIEKIAPSIKLEIIQEWVDSIVTWTDDLKALLVKTLVDGKDEPKLFAIAWKLIGKDLLRLDARAFVTSAFAKYVVYDAKNDKSQRKTRICDDDEYSTAPRITPTESFLVTLALSGSIADACRISLRIAQECDAMLVYQPSGVHTHIEGELLGQLHMLQRQLSPAIQHRRTLGVVIDNKRENTYQYDPTVLIDVLSLINESISIELPHLVYALIDRVEIDVDDSILGAETTIRYATPGIEVLQVSYRNDLPTYSPTNPISYHKTCRTMSMDINESLREKPCAHVSVGLSHMTHIRALRLFGRAIIL